MFQPEVKWKFVERYCNPKEGWEVFVDLDASELGKTGGSRTTEAARVRQSEMQVRGEIAEAGLQKLKVQVGGSRKAWTRSLQNKYPGMVVPDVPGDRDIIAINPGRKKLLLAEAEGDSAGQPEQKLYKAIGQIVIAIGEVIANGYKVEYVLVLSGEKMKAHVARAKALKRLGVSALYIGDVKDDDEWVFGK